MRMSAHWSGVHLRRGPGRAESLEAWTRSEPHRRWWKDFLRDSGGTAFWHEAYSDRGGIEAVYEDVEEPVGMKSSAPLKRPRGPLFGARARLRREGNGPE